MTSAPTFLFAGGGSGGHIAPGLAIAERIVESQPNAECFFLCSARPVDAEMLGPTGFPFLAIPAQPLGLKPLALFRFLRGFFSARAAVRRVIREKRPAALIALGGFVAAPAVAAARAAKLPVTLVNLDAVPGKANHWVARRSTRVLSAVATPAAPNFASAIVGMPIRRNTVSRERPSRCREQLGLDPARNTLLVTGASQGSSSINQLLIHLVHHFPDEFRDWQIIHQSGYKDHRTLLDTYAAAEISAQVLPFLPSMGVAWGAADLAVSRAGASSVAETAANAVPTVFMPYPWHKDQHQALNAEPLLDLAGVAGAAIETDHIDPIANAAGAGKTILNLMRDQAGRHQMREALKANPPADAAAVIAEQLLQDVSPSSSMSRR